MKLSDQKKYTILTSYLKNGVGEILKSQRIMAGLQKYGKFSAEDIQNKLVKWNSGIAINIVDNPGGVKGAEGHYRGGIGGPIDISTELAEQLQKASPEDRQAALLAIFSTILHESVHYGDWSDGFPVADNKITYYNKDGTASGFSNEIGQAFESEVYFNGNFWEAEEGQNKTGKEGLNNMKNIINAKNKNDDDRKDIPTLPGDLQKKINQILSVNPNIHFTIIN